MMPGFELMSTLPITVYQELFFKWANPGLFLFIFVLFKHNFTEKIVGFNGIRTRIDGVEGQF